MMNFGEEEKWYKHLFAIVWFLPIQMIKEIHNERRERKTR